jgi:HUS1 checkpoint protein
MKFKAKLSLTHTQLLYNLINPLSKLQHQSTSSEEDARGSILYLDNDKLVLSTRGSTEKNDSEGIFCFAELITRDGIFNTHVIDSLEHDNAILMEVCIIQFKTALKGVLDTQKEASLAGSLGSSHEVSIKLAKRNGGLPHLCFEVKDASYVGNGANHNADGSGKNKGGIGVNYAVPVKMMRVDELQYHVPPRLGMPDMQLGLPRDRPLRNVVERLRGISNQVYLEGCMAKGILTLRIESDGASIRTSFNKLVPIHEDCKSSQSQQNDEEEGANGEGGASQTQSQSNAGRASTVNEPERCTVKVDSRKLHTSLHWQQSLGIRDVSSAVLCMWENEMLVLDVTLNPEIGRFMYYVPCQYVSADEL